MRLETKLGLMMAFIEAEAEEEIELYGYSDDREVKGVVTFFGNTISDGKHISIIASKEDIDLFDNCDSSLDVINLCCKVIKPYIGKATCELVEDDF